MSTLIRWVTGIVEWTACVTAVPRYTAVYITIYGRAMGRAVLARHRRTGMHICNFYLESAHFAIIPKIAGTQ